MAYHPSAVPALPVLPLPEICPQCKGPLTDPNGQAFEPLFPDAAVPSKVCEVCRTGYWLEDIGWMAVASFTGPDLSPPDEPVTPIIPLRRTARSR